MINPTHVSRFEPLNRENFDTWKIHMEALLIRNDEWDYVNGTNVKPENIAGNAERTAAIAAWIKGDSKAKSDIVLSISATELKQIKGCDTSRDVWRKLETIYQSKGPARKATLLKQLMLHRMEEGGDVREHVAKFFDAVDKLRDMEVEVNPDVLAIALLYSLPPSYENFRVAIESRDELPDPDALRIKIVEEHDAHRNEQSSGSSAMYVNKKYQPRKSQGAKVDNDKTQSKKKRIRCNKCKLFGHKAAECRNKITDNESAKTSEPVSLCASEALLTRSAGRARKWCIDSGATSHLCNNIAFFSNADFSKRGKINLANDESTEIVAEGTARFEAKVFGSVKSVSLNNALHVPNLRSNLLSVGKITEQGFTVVFKKDGASVLDRNGDVKLVAEKIDGLYFVRECEESASIANESEVSSMVTTKVSWHKRLGHLNISDLREAERKKTVIGLTRKDLGDEPECDICLKGKMHRSPFPKKSTRESCMLDLIHSDVCGPMRVASMSGAKYFVEFIDDQSRWCEVRFLKTKNEVLKATKEYIALVQNQKGRNVKCLQTDNGREYLSNEFDDFLKSHGITRRLTVPYNPQQNGVAERKNRSLLDTARCLLIQAELPPCFWAEAVNTANHIRNRCPSKSLNGKTPYEEWTGQVPDVSYLREFGCRVHCLDGKPGKSKLDPRCKEGILVGFSEESKGYRVWLPKEKVVVVSRDVKFSSHTPPKIGEYQDFSPENCGQDITANEDAREQDFIEVALEPINDNGVYVENERVDNDPDEDPPTDGEPAARRGPGRPRIIRTGQRGRPRKQYNDVVQHVESDLSEQASLSEVPMRRALAGPNSEEWFDAMVQEIRSIIKNDTWELVDRPKGVQIIGSRIVLRDKFGPDGNLERRKARLVAQGFSQKPGIHFTETFAPVARLSTIRLIAALAARHGMTMNQFDVTTAYLNGELQEEIFMEPPKLLRDILVAIVRSEKELDVRSKAEHMITKLDQGDKVCLLKKSLYGLRQAGRQWHAKLREALLDFGATPSNGDPCLYYKGQGEDIILIAVYVDDIIIASRNPESITELGRALSSQFHIKDLGRINYCLGIKFNQDNNRVTMNQRGYIIDLLNRFNMTDAKMVSTPTDVNKRLVKETEQHELEEDVPYRELVGSLTYLALATRPDISFAASCLGQFNNSYGKAHWIAAKRVLRYLKGTLDLGLVYSADDKPLKGFVDSDWGNCLDDRRSYSGYVFALSGSPVSWDARKQRTVALSSTEAEYMALTEGAKESIHWTAILEELGFKTLTDIEVLSDNLGALKLANNPVFHARSKHIAIRHHFIREALRDRRLRVEHVSTDDNVADMFTKGIPRPKFEKCIALSGMKQTDAIQ